MGIDIGTGKTLTALYTAKLWGAKKILVICPNSVVKKTWAPQIEQHTDLDYIVLDGTAGERRAKSESNARVHIINFEGLQWVYCHRRLKGFDIDTKSFIHNYDCVIIDEIHKLKSRTSLRTKIAHRLSIKADYAIGLTGTLISTSELDLWAEYWSIDLGESLGTSFYAFRRSYFKQGYYSWDIKPGAYEKILDRVKNITLRYDRDECFDLPDKVYETRSCLPNHTQADIMDAVMEGIECELEDGILKEQNALHRSMRLMQITGGFTSVEIHGGKGIQRISTPKLDMLKECIEEISGKIIIFHQYVEEGRQIEEMLRGISIQYRSLRGEIKDKQGNYNDFRTKDGIKILIAHPKCGGEGIDLIEASTMIFYSNSFSPIDRLQCEGRIYRKGQTKKCLFIDLVLENTIDEIVAQKVDDRKELLKNILNFMKEYKHE